MLDESSLADAGEGGRLVPDGSPEAGPTPPGPPSPDAVRFVEVSLGYDHACAVTEQGWLACWGVNGDGQLGLADLEARAAPTRVGEASDWTAVACGRRHCCGVRGGDGYCWGDGTHGQLGLDVAQQLTPAPVAPADAVAAGEYHTCLLADGRASCFGLGGQGRLGNGDELDRAEAAAVLQGADYTALAVGAAHGCGVRTDGALECWGRNHAGQLGATMPAQCAIGNGQDPCAPTPLELDGGRDYRGVALGPAVTCGIDDSHALRCWGSALWGTHAGEVLAERMSAVALGAAHGCGVDLEGALWCWGANGNGQLGVGHTEAVEESLPVGLLAPATKVSAGALASCALDEDGILWCWGGGTISDVDRPRWMTLGEVGP